MNSSLLFWTCETCFFQLLATIFFMVSINFRFRQNNQMLDSSSLSPSYPSSRPSTLSYNSNHHVFPNFHGADVRKSFLSHLLKELKSKGVNAFIDNNIERSKSIGPELIQAIRGSKIAIVLLSKNYASSSWCLNELVEIMKCRQEFDQIVITIFYDVDPTDVKKQTGDFGKVFEKTCEGKRKKEIKRWRKALEQVATIAGYHSSIWDNEAAMIEEIATDVLKKLINSMPSSDHDRLVGMKVHLEKMGSFLRFDLDEARIIGIWGLPGIGKSTIAKFLFRQLSVDFQAIVFMENIEAMYTRPWLDDYSVKLHLQQQLLSQKLDNQKDIEIPYIQQRLNNKKVLVVLDDVDLLIQLDAMVKATRWFGPGSRIIVTTQHLKLLKAHGINHIYKVDFPSYYEAFQIFCTYAFGHNSPQDGFAELAWEVTYLAGKFPLGLKVMGSYFRSMSKDEWKKALTKLKTRLDDSVQSILKFSYDALDDEEKEVFLSIACSFNHERIEKLEEHLAKKFLDKFLDVSQGLRVLDEKSLVSIENGYIRMHTLLVQLGREISCPGETSKQQNFVDV